MAAESERRIGGRQWESNSFFAVVIDGLFLLTPVKSDLSAVSSRVLEASFSKCFRHFFDYPLRGSQLSADPLSTLIECLVRR